MVKGEGQSQKDTLESSTSVSLHITLTVEGECSNGSSILGRSLVNQHLFIKCVIPSFMKVGDYHMPDDLLYSKEYAWVRREGDLLRIGVIDFAVKLAGKIEYVDLPQKGQHIEKDDIFGTVESGKWVGEMFMPLSAEVVDTNVSLLDAPSPVYDDPYGEGWLILIAPDSFNDLAHLMSDRDEICKWLETEIRAVEKDKK